MFTNCFKKIVGSASLFAGMMLVLLSATPGWSAQEYEWDCGMPANGEPVTDSNPATNAVTCAYHPDGGANYTGTFIVSGEGPMSNYSEENCHMQPWKKYRMTITDLIVEDGVTSIGDWVFYDLGGNRASITIPNTVTAIGTGAFAMWHLLESVTIPGSVATIGDYAFYNCQSLSSLTLGDGVTSIGTNAFSYCYDLISVTISNPTPPTLGEDVFSSIPNTAVLYVPGSSVDTYKGVDGWNSAFATIVSDGHSSIGNAVRAASVSGAASVTVRNRALHVRGSSSEAVSRVRLIDMRGKSVATFTARGAGSFSLGNIPAGRYFVEVREGARRERGSVVVGVR